MIKYGEFVSDKQLAQLLGVSVDMIRSQRRQKRGFLFTDLGDEPFAIPSRTWSGFWNKTRLSGHEGFFRTGTQAL